MAFAPITGALVITPIAGTPTALVVRGDVNQIARLDTDSGLDFAIVRSHPFSGGEHHREARKRAVRLLIWGTVALPLSGPPAPANLLSGTLYWTAENARTDAYALKQPDAAMQSQGLLVAQGLSGVGRWFDVTLVFTGAGVTISDMQLQYTVVG